MIPAVFRMEYPNLKPHSRELAFKSRGVDAFHLFWLHFAPCEFGAIRQPQLHVPLPWCEKRSRSWIFYHQMVFFWWRPGSTGIFEPYGPGPNCPNAAANFIQFHSFGMFGVILQIFCIFVFVFSLWYDFGGVPIETFARFFSAFSCLKLTVFSATSATVPSLSECSVRESCASKFWQQCQQVVQLM